jgi:RimJ/RimL family protein N-acetyltransferase
MNSAEFSNEPLPLDTTIESDRLTLRMPTEHEFEEVRKLTWDASRRDGFNDGMVWLQPETMDDIRTYKESVDSWNKRSLSFTMYENENNKPIGRMSIRPEEALDTWSIGFWMHHDYGRQGYMKEAASMIIDFGFTALQAKQIEAGAATWNEPSQKVLLATGMDEDRSDGHQFTRANGDVVKNFFYKITRQQWLDNQSS